VLALPDDGIYVNGPISNVGVHEALNAETDGNGTD
jgi:hypothetical protein